MASYSSEANINMWGNLFPCREDIAADDGSLGVSFEINDVGHKDTNMDPDVFRRNRWRRPFKYFRGLYDYAEMMSTERIVSTVMTDDVLPYEYFELCQIVNVFGSRLG